MSHMENITGIQDSSIKECSKGYSDMDWDFGLKQQIQLRLMKASINLIENVVKEYIFGHLEIPTRVSTFKI